MAEEDDHRVLLASNDTRVVAVYDSHGEVDVAVFLQGEEPWQGWSYACMVGTASIARVLERTLEQMQAEPAVSRGDKSYYTALAERRRRGMDHLLRGQRAETQSAAPASLANDRSFRAIVPMCRRFMRSLDGEPGQRASTR